MNVSVNGWMHTCDVERKDDIWKGVRGDGEEMDKWMLNGSCSVSDERFVSATLRVTLLVQLEVQYCVPSSVICGIGPAENKQTILKLPKLILDEAQAKSFYWSKIFL